MKATRGKFRMGWFGLLFLASVMMFGCGGGGGDDAGGAAPQPAPTVPDSVNFTISQSAAVPLMRAVVELEDNFTVELLGITAPGVRGTLIRSTEDFILNAGAFSFRTTAPGFTDYTSISVEITEPIAVRGDNNPTAGQLDIVITTTEPNPEYTYLVLNFSAAGIRIRTYTQQGGPPIAGGDVQLTWQQFDDLLNTDPENQLFAKFCYGIWNFLLEQVGIAFDAMEKIINNEDELADGTQTVPGDILPWNQGQAGSIVINSSGSGVQPGFDFELIFANWWVDDPTDDIDDFYPSGSLELLGYIENEGGPIGGDFNFVDFVRQETENNQAPTADQSTVNGGFALLVDW